MKHILSGLILAAALLVATAQAAGVFTLTSPAFRDNGILARKFAGNNKASPNCIGYNVSPPLAWHNPPPGTQSFALVMHDPEARAPQGNEHMVIYGIPAAITHFAEGELSAPSAKFVGGRSTMNLGTYFGPCVPPHTDWHHFTFTIIATDLDPKALPPGLTHEELAKALQGHAKGSAGLIGRFRHPR
jgi:Raf kinase inhibitor-like YbhB/YbcL family protein